MNTFENSDTTLQKIISNYKKALLERSKRGFNLLTVSTSTSHLENFHSDIIAELLNPNGLHGENNLFFEVFLDFLTKFTKINIDKNDFSRPVISREKGRIDIWVRDEISKKSIIIENKINNAPDQDEQIKRYFEFSKDSSYEVVCIAYLSLDGLKLAPETGISVIDDLIINIPAFNKSTLDLYSGWLMESLKIKMDDHAYTFVFQYAQSITHLANQVLLMDTKEEFYNYISNKPNFENISTLVDLKNSLHVYRADRFIKQIDSYHPFKVKKRYDANYWLFQNLSIDGNDYKVDIFFRENGEAEIHFWNPNQSEHNVQEKNTKYLLEQIGIYSEFLPNGYGGGHFKTFSMEDYEYNIAKIDKSLLDLFVRLLAGLKKIVQI